MRCCRPSRPPLPSRGWTAGAGCPCRHWSFWFVRDCPCLAEIPCPGNPVLGEWGGWRAFAQAPVGLRDHPLRSAPPGAPPQLQPWGSSLDALCSPQALGLFSPFSLGKPTRIRHPVLCMSPPQSSRPQLSADSRAVRLLKSRRVTLPASVSCSVKWEWPRLCSWGLQGLQR